MTTFRIENSQGFVVAGKWDTSAAAHIKCDSLEELADGCAHFIADVEALGAQGFECILLLRPIKAKRKRRKRQQPQPQFDPSRN